MNMTNKFTPQVIASNQKIHLQLNENAMIPPRTGPTAGPAMLTALNKPI
jgi:ATP-dependent Lon protease